MSRTGSSAYNAADQLTAAPGHQYTYLGTGSLEYQKDSQGTVEKTYAYTPANLLESVTHAGLQNPSTMTWDADGNRVSFISSSQVETQFVYDITAGIPAVIEETGPAYYVREPNGALIVRLDGQYTNYYHFDALGSTRLLTDAYGTVTDTYAYDAWGGTSDQSGTTVQPYQFVGQLGYYFPIQDENFPLLHLGVRFYDPAETGRFTQVDPAREGASWFVYSDDMPTRLTDPTGRFSEADLTPAEDALNDMIRCGLAMRDAGMQDSADARRAGLVPNTPWDGDALLHCIAMCKMQVHCPPCTDEMGGWFHELPQRWGRHRDRPASDMDVHNNAQGEDCGVSIQTRHYNGSCLDCCVKKYWDGRLQKRPIRSPGGRSFNK